MRERRLGARLDRELDPIGAVVHGCRVPGHERRVDHVVVAPNGIWTVVAEHASGRVRRTRSSGGRLVRIDSIDLADRIAAAGRAAQAVRTVLGASAFDWVDVHPTVCLTNASWGAIAREIDIDGVRVTWGRELVRRVAVRGPLLLADAQLLATLLTERIDVDGSPSRRRADP